MSTKQIQIPGEVLDVLKRAVCDRHTLKIVEQLERRLYEEVNKFLALLGGKWNRAAKAHVFEGDCAERVDQAVMTAAVTDWKKLYQYFPTPPELAARMVELACVSGGERVLEPSAGSGNIVRAVFNAATGADNVRVVAVEINPEMVGKLEEQRRKTIGANEETFRIVHADFLQTEEVSDLGGTMADRLRLGLGRFHAVVMNPPFRNGQDIAHVMHAWKFLKPGGRLVAITSPSWQYRTEEKYVKFRETMARAAEVEELPPGTFGESGTEIRTVLIKLILS